MTLEQSPRMHIVADENIPLLDEFFSGFGRLTRLPGRSIDAAAIEHADILLVRSVTKVTATMLHGTPVRFVGTCTIGTDHLDLAGLTAAGVTVVSAPGCNARGVVEYVLSSLLTLSERTGEAWQQKTVGIIGVGEVGGRLAATLEGLGVSCLLCDPPRAEAGEAGFVSLETLIRDADVISCHVPLTRAGAHPTHHLFDAQRLAALRDGAWLINSSRGPVIDNVALRELLSQRKDLQVVLDVWEQEPVVDELLAARCALATPHIAGYSLDGKLRGTAQIHQAVCDFLHQPPTRQLEDFAPTAGLAELSISAGPPADWLFAKALRLVYDVRDDDARFRLMLQQASDPKRQAEGFDLLRKHYPLRRECSGIRIKDASLTKPARALLLAAGFSL